MPDRKINNPEHYFNRYIACEIKSDGRRAAVIRKHECSLDELLESGRQPRKLAYDLTLSGTDVVEAFMDDIEDEVLHKALQTLTHGQRHLIVLRYHFCLSEREIAEILDIAKGSVDERLQRIRGRLVKKYEKYLTRPLSKRSIFSLPIIEG